MAQTVTPTSVPAKRLSQSITAASTTFLTSDIKGWNGSNLTPADFGTDVAYGVFRDANSTKVELFAFNPATIATITGITFVKRGLSFSGDRTTENAALKRDWTRGTTLVELGSNPPQLFQWLKEYVDAAAIAGGVPASNTALGYTKLATAPAVSTNPIAVGDNDPRVPTLAQIQYLMGITGKVERHAGTTAPAGALVADGSAVSRTTYANLFTAIGTTWGAGDGTTTFNIPNMIDRVPVGAGTTSKVATVASVASNVITVTGLTNKNNNEFQTGQAVVFTATTAGNLIKGTTYYLVRVTNTTFSLATSIDNTKLETPSIITLAGTERGTFTLSFTARAVGDYGGTEVTAEIAKHFHAIQTSTTSISGGTGTSMKTTGTGDTTNYAGQQQAINNMMPFAGLLPVIRT